VPIEINEGLLRAIALKDKTISDGRSLSAKGAYKTIARAADTSLIWGECQGSALYTPSIDLEGDKPIPRCSCPVKPPPCKHVLGLIVHFLEKPAAFKVADPPAELLEKRAKAQERAEKRVEAGAKPREVNKAALAKKTGAQQEALNLLEKLVVDLVSNGLGNLDAKKARRLAEQGRQLNDAYLKGAAVAVGRLAALADANSGEPGAELPDDDRFSLMNRHVVRLWAMVRKGRAHLEAKLEEGETQNDADAVVEDLLGHDWKLTELKEKGFTRSNLELLELAYERFDDAVRAERFEQSLLLDLGDGAVYVDLNMRPFSALEKTKEKETYDELLTVTEAAVYPGFANRRIRWEISAAKRRPAMSADWARVHTAALPTVEAAVAKYKEQIKNPLGPAEAVFLLQAAEFVSTAAGTALVDGKGTRLVLRDSPVMRTRTAALMDAAGGGRTPPVSLLTRFWVGLGDNAIYGQPLALVAGGNLLRLCM
jgi:hypothetical protein